MHVYEPEWGYEGLGVRFNIGSQLTTYVREGLDAAQDTVNQWADAAGQTFEQAAAEIEAQLRAGMAGALGLEEGQIAAIISCGTPSQDGSYIACVASALGIETGAASELIAQYLGIAQPPPATGNCYPVDEQGRYKMMTGPDGRLVPPPVVGPLRDGSCPPGTSTSPKPFEPLVGSRRMYLDREAMRKNMVAQRRWTIPADIAERLRRAREKTAGEGEGMSTGTKVLIGVAAVAAIGAIVYFGRR